MVKKKEKYLKLIMLVIFGRVNAVTAKENFHF